MNSRIIISFFVAPLIFLACQEERQIIEEKPQEPIQNSKAPKTWRPDTAYIQKQLTEFFSTHQVGDTFKVDSISFPVTTMMAELYRQQDCVPLWADIVRMESLIKILRSSEF